MTIPNCSGCEEEWSYCEEMIEEGYHLAQQELTHLGERKHFRIMMVNDNGKIVVE